MQNKLWYRNWTENYINGMPMGNGRLALMALGGPEKLRLAINHEWMWRGENRFREIDDVSGHLSEVRELLLRGEFEEGTKLANDYFGGLGGISGVKNRVDPYEPVGDVFVSTDVGEVSGYTRSLDLDTGLCTVEFDCRFGHMTERVFVSSADGCAVIAIHTEKHADLKIALTRIADERCTITYETTENGIRMNGSFLDGITFSAETAVFSDGTYKINGDTAEISAASDTLVFLQAGTDAKGGSPRDEMTFPSDRDFDRLFGTHAKAFAAAKGEAVVDIEVPESDLPTDERLQAFRDGKDDPSMPLLFFEFGRYLLTSGSSAELPMNLQGKWNEELLPPWDADYHLDINLEMNYWCAETLGMDHASNTLLNLIERFMPYGRVVAEKLYGCRGFNMGIQTDVWGRVTPEASGWAVWIGAAPWLGQHLFRHWRYTKDKDFLRDHCYPYLKEMAAFYEDYCVRHGEQLWIYPSQSPENRFTGTGKYPVSIGINSAMDIELANDTLNSAIECAEELGVDNDLVAVWREMLRRLVKLSIDSTGRLNEWDCEREEVEPGHRHVSQLYGLYPSEQFKPDSVLWKAAEKSLDARMSSGGGNTGWSGAWAACLLARLGRGEESWDRLVYLVRIFVMDSLLSVISPQPSNIFQIDANMGGVACVCEMLLQSRKEELRLLPALPKAWQKGSVRNFRAQDGLTVSFDWENGKLTSCTMTADHPVSIDVLADGKRIPVSVQAGIPYKFI